MTPPPGWKHPAGKGHGPVYAFITPQTTLSDLLSQPVNKESTSIEWMDGPLATAVRDKRPFVVRDYANASPRLVAELNLFSTLTAPVEIRRVY